MSDDIQGRGPVRIAIGLFIGIAAAMGLDLAMDSSEGAGAGHVLLELAVVLVALAGVVLLWGKLSRAQSDLREARVAAETWRAENRELIRGLGAAIEKQFAQWRLTPAEAEIGLLLLKGLSHREIASVRQTSERTIREQARSLYRKSGLSGRSALAAFFLEDLLLPLERGAQAPGPD